MRAWTLLLIVLAIVAGLVLLLRNLPSSQKITPTPPPIVSSTTPPAQTTPMPPVPPVVTTSTTSTGDAPLPIRRDGMMCDETNSICVSQSYRNQLIGNPLTVTGTAIAFESVVSWKLVEGTDGNEIMGGFEMTQAPDVGKPGLFQIRAFFPATYVPAVGEATLILFESSARDGSPIHVLRVPMKRSALTTTLRVHASAGNGEDCSRTQLVTVRVPRTYLPMEASVRRLLELQPTLIPQGTRLISLIVSNGVAKLLFSPELERDSGGSCKVIGIRAQIEKTVHEFASVRRVEVSVEGKTPEETLQP